ncbi:DNA ligase D [Planctomicrobium sp. SH661]|uniref:DNA ligase D n=1 Tax=Planctomicrobium sp. SH661 TaxID=3448124 RepID=UPI003F5CA47E
MNLTAYQKKRNFRKTKEPSGGRGKARRGKLLYVIQKHAASHLHYDFRLELNGTLKSWAVPKGPSLDPHRKQLAVHVEDHPVAYGDFEGTIPKGEYGGGTVMVWDQGWWEPLGDPERDYHAGKLKFIVHGKKLKGGWTLVRMGGKAGEDGKNWLLIKERDEQARDQADLDILEKKPQSVLTSRSLEAIANEESTGSQKKSATRSRSKSTTTKLPESLPPQLATLVTTAPSGETWLHEMKFDGYRLLAFAETDDVRLITRNGNDWTSKFPHVRKGVEELGLSGTILDGEIVMLRNDGIPDFQLLQNAIKAKGDQDFTYYVFDMPFFDGEDLRQKSLVERKELLQDLLARHSPDNDGMVRYSEHVLGKGKEFADLSCHHQMEGIISKRIDSPYESGRTRTWVKTKCHHRQEFVIGGYTRPSGSRTGFGALLLGYYEDQKLRYCGRVGTGFSEASLKEMTRQLRSHQQEECPFSKRPPALRNLAAWVEPVLVAEVEFSEWTDDDQLRHASFQGLRQDKEPTSIRKEKPVSSKEVAVATEKKARRASGNRTSSKAKSGSIEVAGVAISSPDRVVFPEPAITKGELAQFYVDIAEWILPHVVDRPLSLVRCPEGLGGECFYQKHFSGRLPEGVSTVPIKEKNKTDDYPVVKEISGVVSLIQNGVLEIHPWGSRVDKLESPDRIVFDLDPGEGTSWKQILNGTAEIRSRLEDLGLTSFLRTSGGKGLHVVVPLARRSSWDDVKSFAHGIASAMAKDDPKSYTDVMSKAGRKNRIFIDYLRNGRGSTAIASYSTRARTGAPVATPLRWDELTPSLQPNGYTVANLRQRLRSLKADPWEDFFSVQQVLTKKMQSHVGR